MNSLKIHIISVDTGCYLGNLAEIERSVILLNVEFHQLNEVEILVN